MNGFRSLSLGLLLFFVSQIWLAKAMPMYDDEVDALEEAIRTVNDDEVDDKQLKKLAEMFDKNSKEDQLSHINNDEVAFSSYQYDNNMNDRNFPRPLPYPIIKPRHVNKNIFQPPHRPDVRDIYGSKKSRGYYSNDANLSSRGSPWLLNSNNRQLNDEESDQQDKPVQKKRKLTSKSKDEEEELKDDIEADSDEAKRRFKIKNFPAIKSDDDEIDLD